MNGYVQEHCKQQQFEREILCFISNSIGNEILNSRKALL